jgi:hypothetical protein
MLKLQHTVNIQNNFINDSILLMNNPLTYSLQFAYKILQ